MVLRWLVDKALGRNASLLEVGAPAPAFDVLDHEERPVSLASLAGKRFVLWFYPKAGTPG